MQNCLPMFCFTSHLKMTRPSGFFWKPKWKENGVQTAKCIKEGGVKAQDYKLQTCVHQTIESVYGECRLSNPCGCI